MKSIRIIVLSVLISVITLNSFCQEPTQTPLPYSPQKIWVLNKYGEVSVLPAPKPIEEITIDLPGLPEDATPLVLVRIPAGRFLMGSNDDTSWSGCDSCEQPVHEVIIAYDFYMGKFEVTQAQWQAVMGNNPAYYYGIGPNYPVNYISWNDCQKFVAELNKLGQGTFRLPSESEWEYSCRADTRTRFYFGNSDSCGTACEDCAAGGLPGNRSDYMWYCGNNGSLGTPLHGSKQVGGKLPNNFGLYNMHGNLQEWCQDYWHYNYNDAPDDGSPWISPTSYYRVIRGGGWNYQARSCRSTSRNRFDPDSGGMIGVGVRIVREVE